MAKKEEVTELFNGIAPQYDNLNHILSLNIDKLWRKRAIRTILKKSPQLMLDVACGTGDFAIQAAKQGVPQVVGFDISENMVAFGRRKVEQKGLADRVDLKVGDGERMPFDDNSFDAVSIAFGIRNFEHPEVGLREMLRVMKPHGTIAVLEFSIPQTPVIKQFYLFYFKHFLPVIGGWISGHRSAYEYLPQSVMKFPHGEKFLGIMRECGFVEASCRRLSFGIASLYCATKA